MQPLLVERSLAEQSDIYASSCPHNKGAQDPYPKQTKKSIVCSSQLKQVQHIVNDLHPIQNNDSQAWGGGANHFFTINSL